MTSCQTQCFDSYEDEIGCCATLTRSDDRAACTAHAGGLDAGVARCIVDETHPRFYEVQNTTFACEGNVSGGEYYIVDHEALVVIDNGEWRSDCL